MKDYMANGLNGLRDEALRIGRELGFTESIDIAAIVNEKMLFNETRPFKHGKTI